MSKRNLPELTELEHIIVEGRDYFEVRQVAEVAAKGRCFPIHVLAVGDRSLGTPGVGFFGGVHGLERIGTQVLLAYLRSLLARLRWDRALQEQFASVRLVFMPLVNPSGMWAGTRCNPRGVDLMRNAPLEARDSAAFFVGGQRFSRRLPWFRGEPDVMEVESEALCRVVEEELLPREVSFALDCHSGFGARDRIWFPFAHSAAPAPNLPEIHALKSLFDQAYPHHTYLFEPQSRQYRAHGDLWDYLYLCSGSEQGKIFLPLTLEMGSWLWVKKRPRQLFSRVGLFNPSPAHRLHRVLRRHLAWMDFLGRAAAAHAHWLPQNEERVHHGKAAGALWYGERG